MIPTDTASALADDEPHVDADELREHVAPVARAILLHALLIGVAADLLLREGFGGLGFPIWLLLLSLSVISLVWRDGRRVPRETRCWLTVATLLAAAMAWRSAEMLQFFDFAAALFALGMAAISLADERAALFAARIRDTVWAGARVIRSIAIGIIPLALSEAALPAAREELGGRLRPAGRVLVIALPLLFVFGSLLRSADPVFASIVALPAIDFGMLASHVIVVGFFTWVTAGWARGALLAGPAGWRAPERLPFSAGELEVTTALGVLNALFALYLLTQLGWFFGGERFLQARTGLTVAEYARGGFFQMVWVVVLVVPMLLITRAALRPGAALERRHTALALPLIALLGAMIVSAVLRMRLYVHYYGLTLDRFYTLVFMGWLTIVLAWLAVTVLRGRGRAFAGGAVVAGLVILAGLNVAVPDVIVARVNLARAGAGANEEPLDLAHLASLGGEATTLAVRAVLGAPPSASGAQADAGIDDPRCRATTLLLRRWLPSGRDISRREMGDATWRAWNRGDVAAERVVREHASALRAVRHEACARASARTPAAPPTSAPSSR